MGATGGGGGGIGWLGLAIVGKGRWAKEALMVGNSRLSLDNYRLLSIQTCLAGRSRTDKYSIGCMGSNSDNSIGRMGSSMDNSS